MRAPLKQAWCEVTRLGRAAVCGNCARHEAEPGPAMQPCSRDTELRSAAHVSAAQLPDTCSANQRRARVDQSQRTCSYTLSSTAARLARPMAVSWQLVASHLLASRLARPSSRRLHVSRPQVCWCSLTSSSHVSAGIKTQ